ncbi:MAG: DNA ligase D [Gammaproteobacteria bacterium]
MALKKYREKRNLTLSREPRGKIKSSAGKLCFVIQKHAASHLHYDFRLELGGVLKSWAVPKGPPMTKAEKRLAIQVEDHPYDYKDFEGIIPAGHYGAGTVMIWDKGTYEPEGSVTEFRKKLKAGRISFVLHGEKLHGKFSLVKTKGASGQKSSWVFIQSRAKPVESIHLALPKTAILKPITPMLASLIDKPFDHPDWLFEIKWDGYRILAYCDGKHVTLLTRNQKEATERFAAVATELKKRALEVVLDGEMVVLDEKGLPSFQKMQIFQTEGKGQLVYYIFDCLWLNGHDLRDLPLKQRKILLREVIRESDLIKISEPIMAEGKAFFKVAKSHHLEGIIGKQIDSTYQTGIRSREWVKIKIRLEQEAVICGYTAPRGSRKGLGALILGVYKRGQLHYVGHTGTGFTQQSIAALKPRLDKLKQRECPFDLMPPTNNAVTWIKPQLVCQIVFQEWTKDGVMRQPAFLGLREDKLARSVQREISTVAAPKPSKTLIKDHSVKVGKTTLALTHLDKIYWPEERYTKRDLIEYYLRVAPYLFPHIKNRLQVLHRYPNGITDSGFYQKDITHPPEWLKTQIISSESEQRDIRYLVAAEPASLIYMANLGCIEIHPWLSKTPKMDYPDLCVLDLDPEDIDFASVVAVAQQAHEWLETFKIPNFCKTSGATGLHIIIPIKPQNYFEQSKQLAELIAHAVHELMPEITSIERSPKKRQGKVYLDYLQNRFAQTIAAPYSVRPRPGAPVSTPLHWHEVNPTLNPQDFTIKTIFKRLDKMGDIWKDMAKQAVSIKTILQRLQK